MSRPESTGRMRTTAMEGIVRAVQEWLPSVKGSDLDFLRLLLLEDDRYPNLTRPANLPRCLVVEVKCARSDRDLASKMLQGISARVSRHPKYVTGVRAVSGN